jgi:hypothetical protein
VWRDEHGAQVIWKREALQTGPWLGEVELAGFELHLLALVFAMGAAPA